MCVLRYRHRPPVTVQVAGPRREWHGAAGSQTVQYWYQSQSPLGTQTMCRQRMARGGAAVRACATQAARNGDLCRFWRPVRRCGDRRERCDHPARNGGKGIHRVNAGVGQHFQLVGEITLVIHQRVVTCVRECIGCSMLRMCAELRRVCPLRCRRRHIQTGRTDPDTQEKVEDQDRSKTP